MISGLVAGKLFGPAEQRIDKAGKPFAVAKVLAASGLAFLHDEALVRQAKAEFAERRKVAPLVHLLPEGVEPPIPEEMRAVTLM